MSPTPRIQMRIHQHFTPSMATRWLDEVVGFTGLDLTCINIANVIADRRIRVGQYPETPCSKS